MDIFYSKDNKDLVSIITPSYNQGEFIEDTIKSVKNQNYKNIEHIIVDGGSTDKTLDIIKRYCDDKSYNLKWISEDDEGQADAINKGFSMAQGEIIGWLNSDDIYVNESVIDYIINTFKKNKDVDVLYGDGLLINKEGVLLKVECKANFNYSHLLRDCYIMQPSVFFRKEIVKDNKLNIDLNFGMDYDYWLRLGKNYKIKHVNKILAGDRNHSQRKIIAQKKDTQKESNELRKKYGQNFGIEYFLGRLCDKFISGVYRVKGAIKLIKIYLEKDFAFDVNKDNIFSGLYRQLFKKNKDLL